MNLRRVCSAAVVMAVLSGSIAGCGAAHGRAAVIRVSPAVGLYDTPRSIVVSHLAPGQVVTISANSLRSNGNWAASATYVANANGVVDLARAAPRFGSYHGVSPMGLFWSQHRVRAGAATGNSRVTRLTVSSGPRRIGSASVTQILVGPGVTEQRETIATAGFFGRYYAPARFGPASRGHRMGRIRRRPGRQPRVGRTACLPPNPGARARLFR